MGRVKGVTIRDVARRAGVSIAAVSMALNDTGTLSEATRLRVRAVADEMDYQADAIARGLRRSSVGAIGLVMRSLDSLGEYDPHGVDVFTRYIGSASAQAMDRGLGLLLVPIAITAYLVVQQRRSQYAIRFTNLDLLANLVDKEPGWKRHLPTALYIAALAALLFALARPKASFDISREEATVILVTDVSGSMKATDVAPSRLAAAQSAGDLLLKRLPAKFRVGLISFSNGVTVNAEPTTDREQVSKALNSLQPLSGTAMGDGLMQAIAEVDKIQHEEEQQALDTPGGAPTPTATPTDPAKRVPAVIILLSDGQNTVGQADPLDAADQAKARGVPIFTIALGTQSGQVDVVDPASGRTRRIPVPPDEETLQEIASVTDAKFFEAPSEEALAQVYKDLGSFIGKDREQREITAAVSLLAAVLLAAGGTFSLLWFNRIL